MALDLNKKNTAANGSGDIFKDLSDKSDAAAIKAQIGVKRPNVSKN